MSKQDPCAPGGVEAVVLGILRELQKDGGFDVTVTFYGSDKGECGRFHKIAYRAAAPKLLNPIIYGILSGPMIFSQRYDVVNSHAEVGFGFGLLRLLLGKRSRTRYVHTFHGVSWYAVRSYRSQLEGPMKHLSIFYALLVAIAEGIGARTADTVVAVSEGVANELASLYHLDRDRIQVVHNSADLSAFHPRDQAMAKAKLHLDAETKYLLFVGKEYVRKGLRTAVEVSGEVRRRGSKVILLVVGLSEKDLPDFARCDFVKPLGRVSDEDLPFVYAASSVLLHPSLYEGNPVSPLEALASGIPVVASAESKIDKPQSLALKIVSNQKISEYADSVEETLVADPAAVSIVARGMADTDQDSLRRYVQIFKHPLTKAARQDQVEI